MIGVIISCALLALVSAGNGYGYGVIDQPRSSSCAATTCGGGTCVETRNPVTGIVTTTCVATSPGPVPPPRPSPRPSCHNVQCPPGTECQLVQVQCFRPPCYPQPVCVPIQKPGVCRVPGPDEPSICTATCNKDRDCPGTVKCCRNGCGVTTCQDPNPPPPPPPTCDNVYCGKGQECVLKDQPQCYHRPCYPQPTCVDIKPGVCPRPGLGGGSSGIPCQRPCAYDGQCGGTDKCCFTKTCGRVCISVSVDPPTTCQTIQCPKGYVCHQDRNCGYGRPCQPRCVRSNQSNGYYGSDIFTDLGFKHF